MEIGRFWVAAFGRGHAGANPSPSQARDQLFANLELHRIFHQLAIRIEHQAHNRGSESPSAKALSRLAVWRSRAARPSQQQSARRSGQMRHLSR